MQNPLIEDLPFSEELDSNDMAAIQGRISTSVVKVPNLVLARPIGSNSHGLVAPGAGGGNGTSFQEGGDGGGQIGFGDSDLHEQD